MDGFDPSTMTYLAPALSISADQDANTFDQHLSSMNHYSNYEVNTFAGSEVASLYPMQNHMPPISPVPRQFTASVYEEQFSDVVSAFDNTAANDAVPGDPPTIERDHKILNFAPPIFGYVLLDHFNRQVTFSMTAQLHGMFFLAEAPGPHEDKDVLPPVDLTCYRRNLLQITGNITIPRGLRYVCTEQGQQLQIMRHELAISATESIESNAIKLISVPWKTPIPPKQVNIKDKAEKEPVLIPLDFATAQEADGDYASFPFQWKRLQFRIATANNGRRKELQQRFVLHIKVMATLETGQRIQTCEACSSAIIVRGRSPRNFQARKDVPLGGSASHTRKPSSHVPQLSRTSTCEVPQNQANNTALNSTPVKQESVQPAMSIQSYFDPNDMHMNPDLFNSLLSQPMPHAAMTALPYDPHPLNMSAAYPASSPDPTRKPPAPKTAPINLSLVEDEPLPAATPSPWRPTPESNVPIPNPGVTAKQPPSKRPFAPPPRPPSFNLNTIASPDESADALYEYFPLGLDDWMPPVDAVYRPHVVHHINVTADPRDPGSKIGIGGGRSKRYFSESEGVG